MRATESSFHRTRGEEDGLDLHHADDDYSLTLDKLVIKGDLTSSHG